MFVAMLNDVKLFMTLVVFVVLAFAGCFMSRAESTQSVAPWGILRCP